MSHAHERALVACSVVMGLLLGLVEAASGQEAWKASGTVTINKRAYPMKYCYAIPTPRAEPKGSEDINVLVSDAKVAPAALNDSFALLRLAQAGKLNGATFVITPTKQVSTFTLLSSALGQKQVSAGGVAQFVPKKFDAKVVSGKLVAKPEEFMGINYQFDLQIAAFVHRTSAADEEPVRTAVLAFMAAARAKNLVQLKLLVAPKLRGDLVGAKASTMLNDLGEALPPGMTIKNIVVSGATAFAELEKKTADGSSGTKFRLVRVGAAWLVDAPSD